MDTRILLQYEELHFISMYVFTFLVRFPLKWSFKYELCFLITEVSILSSYKGIHLEELGKHSSQSWASPCKALNLMPSTAKKDRNNRNRYFDSIISFATLKAPRFKK